MSGCGTQLGRFNAGTGTNDLVSSTVSGSPSLDRRIWSRSMNLRNTSSSWALSCTLTTVSPVFLSFSSWLPLPAASMSSKTSQLDWRCTRRIGNDDPSGVLRIRSALGSGTNATAGVDMAGGSAV